MSAWAYCSNDRCNHAIQHSDYTIEDICNQSYTCPYCGQDQDVVHVSLGEKLQEMDDRLRALEKKV